MRGGILKKKYGDILKKYLLGQIFVGISGIISRWISEWNSGDISEEMNESIAERLIQGLQNKYQEKFPKEYVEDFLKRITSFLKGIRAAIWKAMHGRFSTGVVSDISGKNPWRNF